MLFLVFPNAFHRRHTAKNARRDAHHATKMEVTKVDLAVLEVGVVVDRIHPVQLAHAGCPTRPLYIG